MVTEVCAGTMTWGSFNNQQEAFAQLDKIVELGINFIDTAELYPVAFNYGKTTEKWMGEWLSKRSAEGKVKRSDLYIATKCNPQGIGGTVEPPTAHGYEADRLEASCRASLARLKIDCIDLYQLHWPCRDTPVFGCASFHPKGEFRPMQFVDTIESGAADGGMATFERQVRSVGRLIDKGLIKHWGLSNENAYGITMFCLAADKLGIQRPVSCQNDFSMVNRTYEADTWEAAYRFGVVGLPYGPLGGGVLSGKYFDNTKYAKADPERPPSECRLRKTPDFQPKYGFPMAVLAAEKYVALAEQYGLTPTELALAWANSRPCNASVIMGTTTVRLRLGVRCCPSAPPCLHARIRGALVRRLTQSRDLAGSRGLSRCARWSSASTPSRSISRRSCSPKWTRCTSSTAAQSCTCAQRRSACKARSSDEAHATPRRRMPARSASTHCPCAWVQSSHSHSPRRAE